jgi:hypothetical protein
MADAKVIDLEEAKASRMAPVRFHTIAQLDRAVPRISISIEGEFTPAAVRVLANAMLQRADAADWEAGLPPKTT